VKKIGKEISPLFFEKIDQFICVVNFFVLSLKYN